MDSLYCFCSMYFSGEIDRCLKKVQEGVDIFEDLWQKVCNFCLMLPTVVLNLYFNFDKFVGYDLVVQGVTLSYSLQ